MNNKHSPDTPAIIGVAVMLMVCSYLIWSMTSDRDKYNSYKSLVMDSVELKEFLIDNPEWKESSLPLDIKEEIEKKLEYYEENNLTFLIDPKS